MDNPEAYTQRAVLTYGRLKSAQDFETMLPEYTEGQKELVHLESTMFGVNPDTDPQRFVDAHAAFVEETEADLQESLPRVKDEVVERVSSYFAGDDELTKQGLKDLMTQRLAATTEVGVYDSLSANKDSGGFFNGVARQPHLVTSEIVSAVVASKDQEEYRETIEKVTLAHEVMHGIFTSGTQEAGLLDHWPIRNGLSVDFHTNPSHFMEDKTIKHGQWLNEAMLESFRWDLFRPKMFATSQVLFC
jgi:hypothetical protein